MIVEASIKFPVCDLIFLNLWGKFSCRQCGCVIGLKGKNVRRHYTRVHRWSFVATTPKQANRKRKQRQLGLQKRNPTHCQGQSSSGCNPNQVKLDKPLQVTGPKRDTVSDPVECAAKKDHTPRPVQELFHALQTTFELLRPQTKHHVMRKMTTTVIDAYYRDIMAHTVANFPGTEPPVIQPPAFVFSPPEYLGQ